MTIGRPASSSSLPLTADIDLEGHRFELRGGHQTIPDRHYLWQAEEQAIVGGVLVFSDEHVWTADTATPEQRAAWIAVLDEMEALAPQLVVPGRRLPGCPGRRQRDPVHTRLPQHLRGDPRLGA